MDRSAAVSRHRALQQTSWKTTGLDRCVRFASAPQRPIWPSPCSGRTQWRALSSGPTPSAVSLVVSPYRVRVAGGAPSQQPSSTVPATAAVPATSDVPSVEKDSEAAGSEEDVTELAGPPLLTNLLDRRDVRTGWTLPHLLAARGSQRELATLLALFPLASSAALAAADPLGRTPLDVALAYQRAGCARVLLRAAALQALPWKETCERIQGAAARAASKGRTTTAGAHGSVERQDKRVTEAMAALRRAMVGPAA